MLIALTLITMLPLLYHGFLALLSIGYFQGNSNIIQVIKEAIHPLTGMSTRMEWLLPARILRVSVQRTDFASNCTAGFLISVSGFRLNSIANHGAWNSNHGQSFEMSGNMRRD
jgi:hypothetical protein